MLKVSIVGGSGYAGGELLRLLLGHSKAEIVAVTSRSHVTRPVSDIHPNLRGLTQLSFASADLETLAEQSDVIFFALPHAETMQRVPKVLGKARVIDLGGDFRLKNAAVFEQYYGIVHSAPELLAEAAYGLPEFYAEDIQNQDVRLVACPGCFPTGALLALMPLAKAGLIAGPAIIDAKTGSSGSGATPSLGTHHPERAFDFKAYKIFSHRHLPEIVQALEDAAKQSLDVTFTPHSAPMVRGIFTTAYAFLDAPITQGALHDLYEAAYADAFFVRLVQQSRSAVVAHSNFCDISLACDGHKVVVTSAIDNLVKGAAGQAVQVMNLMFGYPEHTGLTFPGTHP